MLLCKHYPVNTPQNKQMLATLCRAYEPAGSPASPSSCTLICMRRQGQLRYLLPLPRELKVVLPIDVERSRARHCTPPQRPQRTHLQAILLSTSLAQPGMLDNTSERAYAGPVRAWRRNMAAAHCTSRPRVASVRRSVPAWAAYVSQRSLAGHQGDCSMSAQ